MYIKTRSFEAHVEVRDRLSGEPKIWTDRFETRLFYEWEASIYGLHITVSVRKRFPPAEAGADERMRYDYDRPTSREGHVYGD